MADTLLAALSALMTFDHLLYMLIGVSVGLVIGVIPGLGGIAGLSLLMPFLYGMDEISALAMLIGLVAVIPPRHVLLCVDGHSRLVCLTGDGAGWLPARTAGPSGPRAFSGLYLFDVRRDFWGRCPDGFVVVARPLILMFGSAELFMLALFGLSMVAVLAGRSLAKGLAACAVGLLIGSIGGAPATGEFRMTFGLGYLYDGIPLVVIGLGLFAIPEISDLLRKNAAISDRPALGSGWARGFKDWYSNIWLSLRCSGMGCMIGAIPGLGGSVVDWIAYGHAVQTCKNPPRPSARAIRAVLSPLRARITQCRAGALLPTMLFGIPGSGSMAVFLGGMVLLGIEPGPAMVTTNLDVTYSVIWSLALANVMGAGICLMLAIPISRLTQIRFPLLAPFMIALICFAAFQATRDIGDLLALLSLGLLGILMKRFAWPRPAMLIGFVLAPQAETYLYQALQFYDWAFLTRPGVIIIGLMALASVIFGLRNRVDDTGHVVAASDDTNEHEGRWTSRTPQIVFAAVMIGLLVMGLKDALDQSFLAAVFPASVAVVGLAMALWLVPELIVGRRGHAAHYDSELDGEHVGKSGVGGLWDGGAVDRRAGSDLRADRLLPRDDLVLHRLLADPSPRDVLQTAIMTVAAAAFILLIAKMLSLNFPSGVLQSYLDLPWPFR